MVTYRDIASGLKEIRIDPTRPLMVHSSLSAFGEVRGGAETLLGVLLANVPGVMMPSFTYKTMLTPESGPENNAITYGSGKDTNRMTEFFHADMSADPLMGKLVETLRKHARARRSLHPILSFAGIGVDDAIEAQTMEDPLAPIGAMVRKGGWVLLAGVNHTVNTSIHYAEKMAGRRQFIRWALTTQGVYECPGFPGCSDGFEKAVSVLDSITRRTVIGAAQVRALPMAEMMEAIIRLLKTDPKALLCSRAQCERCDAIRNTQV
jgi:aminoglycoside 3-N-acetyltransferase